MNLNNINKIYFIGIGGVAMSAVAAICKKKGFDVYGSDSEIYPPTSTILDKNNIVYKNFYNEKNLTNPDLIVVGAGESPETNPEVRKAVNSGIKKPSGKKKKIRLIQ